MKNTSESFPGWHKQLEDCNELRLLPCGAAPSYKAPVDKNGKPMRDWQNKSFTPTEIIEDFGGVARCVGSHTGPKAGGLIFIDLDGLSAINYCKEKGCNPDEVDTWKIERDTDKNRLKLVFTIYPQFWKKIGRGKRKIQTGKSEQVEMFFGSGQCLILGEHVQSGGNYEWVGSPLAIAEPPKRWWKLIIEIFNKEVGNEKQSKSSEVQWQAARPCPICTRDKDNDCRINPEGNFVLCHRGKTFHPPHLTEGQTIQKDNKTWAYVGEGEDCTGTFSKFKIDEPIERPSSEKDLAIQARNDIEKLNHELEKIENSKDTADVRLRQMQLLPKHLDLSPKELNALINVRTLANNNGPKTLTELMSSDIEISEQVDRLIARGVTTLLVAESGVGKTAFIYQLALACANGNDFANRLKVKQAPVLMIQADESQGNAMQKFKAMGAKPNQPDIHFEWSWHQGMFLELKQWIEETKAKVVLMDSLGCLLLNSSASMNDSEIALPLYRLNTLASELNVSIVITHHLRKGEGGKARSKISHDDIFGSVYLRNSVSDILAIRLTDGNLESHEYTLKVLKNRSMISSLDDQFKFSGCSEDLSIHLESINGEKDVDEKCQKLKDKLIRQLRKSNAVNKENAIPAEALANFINVNSGSVRTALSNLYINRSRTSVERTPIKTDKKGRPSYRYFLAE